MMASFPARWKEVVSAPAERVLPLPQDMGFEAGAAAPLNYLTGLFALVRRARARAGETLLVHGAAGGVGTAAIQLGAALGLRTVAVVGDEAKREFALRCGAHHAVLSHGWLAAVRDLLGERAVDIVLDPVGGDRMTDSLRILAPEGRLLVLGFSAGEYVGEAVACVVARDRYAAADAAITVRRGAADVRRCDLPQWRHLRKHRPDIEGQLTLL